MWRKKLDVIGIIPAAGKGTRLNLPFSKELFPLPAGNNKTITPVINYLLYSMSSAGIKRVFTIISKEKKDLLQYLGSGSDFNFQISYLLQDRARGMPEAISLVTNWINRDTIVAFGMPDTIFFPTDAMRIILNELISSQADLILGLFPTETPNYFGVVDFDEYYRPIDFIDKPTHTEFRFVWGIGCWKFRFMEILNSFVQHYKEYAKELILSDIFKIALSQNLDIRVYPFHNGEYYDIGITSEIPKVIKRLSFQFDASWVQANKE